MKAEAAGKISRLQSGMGRGLGGASGTLPEMGAVAEEDDEPCEVLARLIDAWVPGCMAPGMGPGAAGGKLDEVEAQSCLARFEFAVHLMLEQYLDEAGAQIARTAYDAGLSAGFYGAQAAITQGLGVQMERALGGMPAGGESGYSPRLMRQIWKAGHAHACLVREWTHAPARRDGTHC